MATKLSVPQPDTKTTQKELMERQDLWRTAGVVRRTGMNPCQANVFITFVQGEGVFSRGVPLKTALKPLLNVLLGTWRSL